MMRRRSLLAAASATPLAFRAMAQSGAAGKAITLVKYAPLTIDPAHGGFSGYPSGYEAALCLYDRILDFDAHMNIVPGIAESWTIDGDLMSATLILRGGVKFHDGTACDADAVKFNLERLIDKQRTTTNRPLWDPLASVEVTDPRTVVIKLKAPFTTAEQPGAWLGHRGVSAAVTKYGEIGIAQNPVGAGPFRLAKFSPRTGTGGGSDSLITGAANRDPIRLPSVISLRHPPACRRCAPVRSTSSTMFRCHWSARSKPMPTPPSSRFLGCGRSAVSSICRATN